MSALLIFAMGPANSHLESVLRTQQLYFRMGSIPLHTPGYSRGLRKFKFQLSYFLSRGLMEHSTSQVLSLTIYKTEAAGAPGVSR